nr:phosphoribosylanthranilate isomerase [Neisseria arctica]
MGCGAKSNRNNTEKFMNQVRTKICGITSPEDAYMVAEAGADAIGLVFYEKSKRFVDIATAQTVVRALPPFVSVVALFVNASQVRIQEVLAAVPIDVLQFHGDETADFCRSFGRPYLKAVRVRNTQDILDAAQAYPDARGILFDAHIEGEYGGTGLSFDWQLLPEKINHHWILSGGLSPENVTQAVKLTGALAVDVSSGVELVPGIKSKEKVRAFIANAQL